MLGTSGPDANRGCGESTVQACANRKLKRRRGSICLMPTHVTTPVSNADVSVCPRTVLADVFEETCFKPKGCGHIWTAMFGGCIVHQGISKKTRACTSPLCFYCGKSTEKVRKTCASQWAMAHSIGMCLAPGQNRGLFELSSKTRHGRAPDSRYNLRPSGDRRFRDEVRSTRY